MKRIFVCFILSIVLYASCCSADMMYRYNQPRPWYVEMLYHIKVKGGYVITEPKDSISVSSSVDLGRSKRLYMRAGTSGTEVKYEWRF